MLKLREFTTDEDADIKSLARSRTSSARSVERAKIILLAAQGNRVPAIATRLKISQATARTWISRFNVAGLAGLNDRERSGRPTTYSAKQVAAVIEASITNPQTLDLPFGSWTMDRLAAYLKERKKIAISRSRISELLVAEGLRWRSQETWFGERVDPEFAEKRGASRRSTLHRLKIVGS